MATAANILIEQGTTFSMSVNLFEGGSSAVDLTDTLARGTIRKSYGSGTSLSFDITLPSNPESELILYLTPAQTGALKPGRYVYDVELYNDVSSPAEVQRILEGYVEVTPSVSNAYPTGEGVGAESPSGG